MTLDKAIKLTEHNSRVENIEFNPEDCAQLNKMLRELRGYRRAKQKIVKACQFYKEPYVFGYSKSCELIEDEIAKSKRN